MSDFEIIAGKLYRCSRCGVRYWTDAGEHRCSELHMSDMTVDEHYGLMQEIADLLRWRPMHSAPKDGTVIEGLWVSQTAMAWCDDGVWWKYDGPFPADGATAVSSPNRWRPAHPEWNEEETDDA